MDDTRIELIKSYLAKAEEKRKAAKTLLQEGFTHSKDIKALKIEGTYSVMPACFKRESSDLQRRSYNKAISLRGFAVVLYS